MAAMTEMPSRRGSLLMGGLVTLTALQSDPCGRRTATGVSQYLVNVRTERAVAGHIIQRTFQDVRSLVATPATPSQLERLVPTAITDCAVQGEALLNRAAQAGRPGSRGHLDAETGMKCRPWEPLPSLKRY